MNLEDFNQGQHKSFLPSSSTDSISQLNSLAEKIKRNQENSNSVSLLKELKELDNKQISTHAWFLSYGEEDSGVDPSQFNRFLTFIKSIENKECKAECTMFLYPLYVHTYLNLLQSNLFEKAYDFGRELKSLFSRNEHYYQNIEDLLSIRQYKEYFHNADIRTIRDTKYEINITEESLTKLEQFFVKEENFKFLEFMQAKLRIGILNPNDPDLDEKENDEEASAERILNGGGDSDMHLRHKGSNYEPSNEFRKFLEARNILDRIPNRPSNLLCWGINNLERVSCAEINEEATLLLTGTLSGQINISKLVQPLLNDFVTIPVNTVPLAAPSHENISIRAFERTSRQNMNIYGNKGEVYDLCFVPESNYCLSVSSDNYMRAYSTETNSCVMKYSGHDRKIWCVESSNKGLAVTGSADTTARLWSLEHLHPLRILVGHRQDVQCAKFHPNHMYIATGSYDKSVRLWSITEGRSMRLFTDHNSPVLSVAFSPCGKYLGSGDMEGEVIVNDLINGRVISRFNLNNEPVISINWNTTGETLAAASLRGTVTLHAWPSKSKISQMEGSDIAVFENVFQRTLNIQYKKTSNGHPVCLGVSKDVSQNTFVVKEEPS